MTRAWTATTRRRVRDLLGALVECADTWGPESSFPFSIAKGARTVLPLLAERAAPSRVLPGKSRKADRAERRERHRQETARIHEERMRIAGERCEWPMEDYPQGRCLVISPLHLHHLEGGSGRRRQQQTVENTRMYCMRHHVEAHRAGARRDERGAGK